MNNKPTQIIGGTRLTGGDIKPLNRKSEKVGKIFKSTKEKITWSFDIKRSSYAVELFASNVSGKKRIKVNGKLLGMTKADKNCSPAGIALPINHKHSDKDLQFAVDGIRFEVTISTQKNHDLVINGHSFAELNEERVGNIAGLIKQSKIKHFDANVVTNRQSSLHVLTMGGSDTDLQSSQEGGNCCTQITPENPPEVSHRSSRLSTRNLRRSDASVKDINVPCLPSQLSQRGFRRSEASVKDLAMIGTDGRKSSVRGFRRSNAIIQNSSGSFGSTTSITPTSENFHAQTTLQLPQSNFDSTLSLTNFDSTSCESIPLNEVSDSEGAAAPVFSDGAIVSKGADTTVRVSTDTSNNLESKIRARKSHANSFVEALRP